MSKPDQTVRVAAAQLAAGVDLDANLEACRAAIDVAADRDARLVVLPEFCNHPSWYDDAAHCYRVAVELDGVWLGAIAARARARHLYVVVNATVRRDGGACTGTSVLFGPDGSVRGVADKQVLIGHESDFLRPATAPAPVVATALGRISMYACMDGVICETARGLALRGAEILCNSLNSFALDEASLHVPVRAAENRVFVVAANKVGPLIPEPLLAPVSAATAIPVEFLHGAGESQIVGPDGSVRAIAPRSGATVVVADITPRQARDKRRPDGTDVFASRRPALYRPLAADPAGPAGTTQQGPKTADSIEVSAVALEHDGEAAIAEAAARVTALAAAGVSLVVLPELFCFEGGRIDDIASAGPRAERALAALIDACPTGLHVVTSLPLRDNDDDDGVLRLTGVVIGHGGVISRQPQLHACAAHAWSTPSSGGVVTIDLPWGRLGLAVGDDAIYPETFRLLGLAGASVVAAPVALREPWEASLGLVERSAENRINLVAATRPSAAGTALCTTLTEDFTLMTPWRERAFDGLLSQPIVVRGPAGPGVVRATARPAAATNKVVSHRTDLLAARPWRLAAALTQEVRHDA